MEVSAKTFREVEFREKMRGYHPEDVDQFLEQMAAGVEVMQDRLRQAVERAQRAEQLASEAGTTDETLRRTLVLAQRTADQAVQEARDQAERVVATAEQQARSIVADAEERAKRMHSEALADVQAELAKLESVRAQAQEEVDTLNRWAQEHRTHLTTTLRDALAMVDRAEVLAPAPTSTPVEVSVDAPPAAASEPAAVIDVEAEVTPEPKVAPPPEDATEAVSTAAPSGGTGERLDFEGDEHDEAMDSFFDDADLDDDRRFGSRLRRRR